MSDSSSITPSAGDDYVFPPSAAISSSVLLASVIFLFAAVVFVALLYLYVRRHMGIPGSRFYRSRSRLIFVADAAVSHGGLDAAVLESLPVTVYRAAEFKEGLECAVCLSDLTEGQQARLLPKCNHGFHVECIDMWFRAHSTCPLCRSPVGAGESPESDTASGESASRSADPAEPRHIPANVLFWGSREAVNNREIPINEAAAPPPRASSSSASGKREGMLVIDIPRPAFQGLPSPAEDSARSPLSARLRALGRYLSRGNPSAPGSSLSPGGAPSRDLEEGGGIAGVTPKAPSKS